MQNKTMVRVFIVGDVVGEPGIGAIVRQYPLLKEEKQIHCAIVNAENMAEGSGITEETLARLMSSGIDLVTGGDHQGKKRGNERYIMHGPRLIRPANYVDDPGVGAMTIPVTVEGREYTLGVVNVLGRVFMKDLPCPFKTAEQEVMRLKSKTPMIVVDFHAEATSEKIAMGWFLNGQVSAVVGTHTHVQTADEQILSLGTAYITDLGMTGGHDGVIGRKKENVLLKFLNQPHKRFEVATGCVRLNGLIVDLDPESGRATYVERVSLACD